VPDAAARSARSWIAPALVAVAAGVFQLPFFDRTLSVLDEGHILMFADIVANGGELYRDAELLPLPGAFYLLAGAFEVFGPSIRVARWLLLVEFALLCAFGFCIVRRLASTRAAFVAVGALFVYRIWAFPHWHMYSYSTTSLCLIAAALVCAQRQPDGGVRRWLAATGALAGLAILAKQDYGAAGLLALNVWLFVAWRTRPRGDGPPFLRQALWLNAPVAALLAVTALHFLRQGLFLEMLRQTVLHHLTGIATFEYSSLPPLWPLFGQSELIRSPYGFGAYTPAILFQVDWARVTASALYTATPLWDLGVKLFFYGPYVFLLAGALRLWRGRARLRDADGRPAALRELALFAVAAALIAVLNKPVDYVHVVVLYWPLLLLAVIYASAFSRARPRLARALGLAGALPATALAAYSGFLIAQLALANDTPLRGERAGVRVLPTEDRVLGGAVDYVVAHSDPGDPVAVLPYYPLISFLADRRAPHRSTYTFWPIEYVPGREQQVIDAMETARSDFFVYHFTQFAQFPRMEDFAPRLFAYLVDTYDIDEVISDPHWGMMLAGVTRGNADDEGVPIFAPGADGAGVAVEGAHGRRRAVDPQRRAEVVEEAAWPFRRVLALRPLAGGRRSVLSTEVEVPEGARLRTEVGVHAKHWFRVPPAKVTFSVWAVDADERTLLATRTINPQADARDRRWHPIDVDLAPWSGRRIGIDLTAETDRPEGERLEMGGFATPRLVNPKER